MVVAAHAAESGGELNADAAPEPDTSAAAPGATAPELTLPYATVFSDIDDSVLAKLIEQSSQLKGLEAKPTATYTGLVRRAEADRERLRKVLRSEGYYDGTVAFRIDEGSTPVKVSVDVDPGAQYRLARYEIGYVGDPPAGIELAPGLKAGMPARAKPIADEQVRLIDTLRDRGRPFATVADRAATIDRSKKTMVVVLTIDPGPAATFGPVTIEGLKALDPNFVRAKIRWREGERFDQSQVEKLRALLLGLGRFRSVKIDHAKAVSPDGSLPIAIVLAEAKQRSLGAGAAISTSEGFLVDAFWEHRNLLGAAEKLRLTTEIGTLSQRVIADFRKPDFRRLDQDLLASTSAVRTHSDAFDELTSSSFVGLERRLSERWRISGGGSFDLSRVTDAVSTENVALVGLPLTAVRDDRDSVLNPTRGGVLGLELTPYAGRGIEPLSFALGGVTVTGYRAVDDRRRIVFAGRTRLASLAGEETQAIPANKRLYSGGGGSVRGYAFQTVGPLDAENHPVGGRSLFEIGTELRLRLTGEIGVVGFVEGGNVTDGGTPDLRAGLRWAGGLGLRYFTPIGPVRVDVAVPIHKRENIDADFQVYFSLGQAF